MHQRFLDGLDKDFDYSQLGEKYDDHKQIDRDNEEKWFDDEEPSSGCGLTDTGV